MEKENLMKAGVQDLRTNTKIENLQKFNILLKFRINHPELYFLLLLA